MDAPVLTHPATVATTGTVEAPAAAAKSYPALTAKDRCDDLVSKVLRDATDGNKQCGAQAFMRAVVTEDQHLLFCAHHGRRQMPALANAGIRVIDESGQINDKPTDASTSNGF